MKNLLIYFNPEKKFAPEYEDLTRIQIDNSLSLGWDPKDIVLVTNFPYEYRGVKAIVIGEGKYEVFDQNKSSKIPIINRMFADGLIEDELYWFHDVDAFQLVPFEMQLEKDAGFTNHGWSKKWNAGSFFFKKEARDIFERIWEVMGELNSNEQGALTYIWQNNTDGINSRYQLINITFNIGIYYIPGNLRRADLPVKVAHFHPHKKRHFDLFKEILPERLVKIFANHGASWPEKDLNNPQERGDANEELKNDLQAIRVHKRKNQWEPFMRKYNCQIIAEIGVQRGINFAEMIKHNPKEAIAVDSWIEDGVISRNDGVYPPEVLEQQYQQFKKSVEGKSFVKILREYSFDAVKHFPDNYFDLVYIDADHSYEGCRRDLEDWYPKIKQGKYLIGDDYRNYESLERKPGIKFGVIEAVNNFVRENSLTFFELPWNGWAIVKDNSTNATSEPVRQDLLSLRKDMRVWEPFMRKYNCQRVCELGVYKGDNFEEMIAHNPKLAVAVDAWKDFGGRPKKYDDYTQEEFEAQYEFVKTRFKEKPFVQIVRQTTLEAAKLFPDEYFDFVYIDTDHNCENVYADILAWYPKVKTGKFLAGHDYRRGFGVVEAVDKFIKDNSLKMFFLPRSNWLVVKE